MAAPGADTSPPRFEHGQCVSAGPLGPQGLPPEAGPLPSASTVRIGLAAVSGAQFADAHANSAFHLAWTGCGVQPAWPGGVQKAPPSFPAAWTISTFSLDASRATAFAICPMYPNSVCQAVSVSGVQYVPPQPGAAGSGPHQIVLPVASV